MATYVLCHGAHGGGWQWRTTADLLRSQGHVVFTPTLTGLGERVHLLQPDISLETHITDIVNVFGYEQLEQVILVGHTDASGPLDMNVAVSRKRAESVVARLINVYGVPSAQVSAEGVGYLSPRASNLTDEGRHKNRRVEAVLASTR